MGGGIKFHTDLEKVEKEEIIGVPIIIFDARVIDDWDSDFGTTKFALVAFEWKDYEGKKSTTLLGGKAVVRQVEKLLKLRKLPGRIRCFLSQAEGPNGLYWLLDSETPPAEEEKEKEEQPEELFA